MEDLIRSHRRWLKDSIRKTVDWSATDQSRGLPPPPVQKPVPPNARTVALPEPGRFGSVCTSGLLRVLRRRRSIRRYAHTPLSIEELAFLLWATQGITERHGDAATFRPVPSAGARHAFETYLYCRRVETLEEGIYRYLPLDHRLLFEFTGPGLGARISEACFGQGFVGQGAVTFFWSVIPYRMEWRYGPAAHRVLPMDAGHVCQNLYLAAEAIGAGACAVAAYDQEALDALLHLDGEEEFVIYLAPVGKRIAPDRRPGRGVPESRNHRDSDNRRRTNGGKVCPVTNVGNHVFNPSGTISRFRRTASRRNPGESCPVGWPATQGNVGGVGGTHDGAVIRGDNVMGIRLPEVDVAGAIMYGTL